MHLKTKQTIHLLEREHKSSDSECDCSDCIPLSCAIKREPIPFEDVEEEEGDNDDFFQNDYSEEIAPLRTLLANESFVDVQNVDFASASVSMPSAEESVLLTLAIKCPLDQCNVMMKSKTQVEQHLLEQHRILSHRCLCRGCNRSFKNK